jgi:hypothetical protein
MYEYVLYYQEDRTHFALAKGTPDSGETASKCDVKTGGLNQRWDLAA